MAWEWWGFRKTTRPLAREGRNLRSGNDMFYRSLFGRIAPFPSRGGPSGQILDSVAKNQGGWLETLICTVKHDTFDAEGAFRPRGTQIPGGNMPCGARVFTKSQRAPWVFRQFNQPREIIRTNILILIISLGVLNCRKTHDAR